MFSVERTDYSTPFALNTKIFCNFYIFGDKLTFLGFVLIAVYTMVGLTVRGTFHHVKVIEQVKHMIYNTYMVTQ